MKSLFFVLASVLTLAAALSSVSPELAAGEVTMYGIKFPRQGPRSSGVVRVEFENSPWRSPRKVKSQADFDRLVTRGERLGAPKGSPLLPAVFYVTPQKVSVEQSNLAKTDFSYFHQQAVKEVLGDFRWYWTYADSVTGTLLAKKYALKKGRKALIFLEPDGSLLHLAPIAGPKSVSGAMRMIGYKRQMAAALDTDLPLLSGELEAGNIETVMKYLRHIETHKIYASERTMKRLSPIASGANALGEARIKEAQELASKGERKKALSLLRQIKKDFSPLEASQTAARVAKKIKRKSR